MKDFSNTLFLEARGCYFWHDDKIADVSDVGNYRVCAEGIKAKNGREYFLEFGYYDRRETRYTHKVTNKPLKHPKTEVVLPYALHIDPEFDDERGSWRDLALENALHDKMLTFTKANILTIVNEISIKQYTDIIVVNRRDIVGRLAEIYALGGYREKLVIDNLKEIKRKEYPKDYRVLEFIANDGKSFEFETHSNRIVG